MPPVTLVCILLNARAEGNTPAPPVDARAGLLLDIMLGTLLQQGEPPSLAHLLLGFDTTIPPARWFFEELEPQHQCSCLTVLLKALQVGMKWEVL
jgi:hypothetical protein